MRQTRQKSPRLHLEKCHVNFSPHSDHQPALAPFVHIITIIYIKPDVYANLEACRLPSSHSKPRWLTRQAAILQVRVPARCTPSNRARTSTEKTTRSNGISAAGDVLAISLRATGLDTRLARAAVGVARAVGGATNGRIHADGSSVGGVCTLVALAG